MAGVTIDDDSVRAYAACRELRLLYQAYQATSRAHVLVLDRIARAERRAPDAGSERRARAWQQLAGQRALAVETEAVFAIRDRQLRERLLELRGLAR